jgi:hypothetical protein
VIPRLVYDGSSEFAATPGRHPRGREMRIDVRLPADRPRRWHLRVVEEIARTAGAAVAVTAVPGDPTPTGLDLLFALERTLGRGRGETAADRLDPGAFAGRSGGATTADLVVDLTGRREPAPAGGVRLEFAVDEAPPLTGTVAAILAATSPRLTVDRVDADGRRRIDDWRVAIEEPRRAIAATAIVLARLAHLAIRSATAIATVTEPSPLPPGPPLAPDETSPTPSTLAFARATLGRRIADRLRRMVRSPDDWRILWRLRDPARPFEVPQADPTRFRRVPDDGRRFFADPFPIRVGGRSVLFAEEFPYATGKGILSVAEIGDDGRPGDFRPILEDSCHLSWPHVFEHAGTVWMIPESTGRRRVELWRAVDFPDRWVLDTVLLDDVEVHDPAVAEIDGAWLMFGNERSPWCSSWDALIVFSAPALGGPWRPLGDGPLRVDVASTRPAGRMFRLSDGWRRPVQDSSTGYGSGLAVTRPTIVDGRPLGEVLERRIRPVAPARGLHTWNRSPHGATEFETVDVLAPASLAEELLPWSITAG